MADTVLERAFYESGKLDSKIHVVEGFDAEMLTLELFLDLSKASDTINHYFILSKFEHYGTRGHVLDWFRRYLSARRQYTDFNKSQI